MALIPSIDFANLNSLEGLFRQALGEFLKNFDTAMPAIVTSYDANKNRAAVSIPINILLTNGQKVKRPSLASVPVVRIGGGGYFIYTPLKSGDSGWVIACDRDIFNYLQGSGAQTTPNTMRAKSFSDAFFIPDNLFKGTPANQNAVTIQSEDGTTRIEIENDNVIIKAKNITLDGDITVTGKSTFTDKPTINNDLRVNGNITASGDITPNVPS